MKYAKFLVALLAVCTLIIIPAFSMPDCGNAMKDCKKQVDSPCQGPIKGDIAEGPEPCPCSENKMGPDGDKCTPKSMMDGRKEMNGCDKPMMGQDDKPMVGQDDKKPMTDGCDKSMVGLDDKKPMTDGRDKSMMGQDDKKPMTDGCDKPMMGPDGYKPAPKSMMGPDGDKCAPKPMNGPMDQECPCHSQ